MSNELKEAAQQALKELGEARKIVRASSSRQLAKDWDRRATDALANLREAIQQAETQHPIKTQQPVTAIACGIPGMTKTSELIDDSLISAAPYILKALRSLLRHAERVQEVMDEECGVRFRDDGPMEMARDALARVDSAPDQTAKRAPSVPEGYALVPIEPTQAMMNVQTWDFSSFYSPREIWAAMLAAKDSK